MIALDPFTRRPIPVPTPSGTRAAPSIDEIARGMAEASAEEWTRVRRARAEALGLAMMTGGYRGN